MAKKSKKNRDADQLVPAPAVRTWYVREWLTFLGMKQARLEERTGKAKSHMSEMITEKKPWNRKALFAVADALGVRPIDLLRPPPDPDDLALSQAIAELSPEQKRQAAAVLKAMFSGQRANVA